MSAARWLVLVAGAMLLLASALVPAEAIVRAFDPAVPPERLDLLLAGAWLLKLVTALHGAVLLLVARGAGRQTPPGDPGADMPHMAGMADMPHMALWTPPAPGREGPVGAAYALTVLAVLVVGLAVRLIGLGSDLWLDEVTTLVYYVRPSLGQIAADFSSDNQHQLYSLLAHVSVRTLGESATALRLPALLFGLLSLALTLRLGRLVAGQREALLATALLALSYHHVWFSQNARGYTGLLFFTLLTTDFLLRALSRGSPGQWLGYAVAAALGAWVHLTMAFVLLGQAAVVLVLIAFPRPGAADRARGRALAGLLLAGSLTFQVYALVLPQVVAFFSRPGAGSTTAKVVWKSPLWLVNETLRGLGLGLALGWIGLAAALLLFSAGLWSYLRRDRVVTALFLLPAVFGAAAMLALHRNLWPRFFFNELGFAVLLAVRGAFAAGSLARLAGVRDHRRWGTVLAVLLVAASAAGLPRGFRHPKQDFTGARDFVRAQQAPGDRVVGIDLAGDVYRLYYAPDWGFARNLEELDRARAAGGVTWVLYTLPGYLAASQPGLMKVLEEQFELVRVFPGTLGDGAIVVRRNGGGRE